MGPQRIFCSFLEAEVEHVVHSLGQRADKQRPLSCQPSLWEPMQLPKTPVGSQEQHHLCSGVPVLNHNHKALCMTFSPQEPSPDRN